MLVCQISVSQSCFLYHGLVNGWVQGWMALDLGVGARQIQEREH